MLPVFCFLAEESHAMKNRHKNRITRIFPILPLFVAGFVFSGFAVATASASAISPSDVIALANGARAQEGLASLAENSSLSAAAAAKAADMLKNDYFAHTSPDGISPWHWIKQAGYRYKAAGENLAINFDTAKEQHSAWMKSATHRANILNGQYREIGVAVVKGKIDGQESIVTVEFFGTPIYVAADRAAAVPPIVQKSPAEIRGTETQAEAAVPDAPVIVPALPAENIAAPKLMTALPAVRMSWLDIATLAFTAVLLFAAFAAPAAFLAVAYEGMAAAIRARHAKTLEIIASHQGGILEYHLRL